MQPYRDAPRLGAKLNLIDVTFHSAALARDMRYRAILPKTSATQSRLPVLYLLHGGGGDYRDWSNYSDVSVIAEKGVILIMPQGDDSYYTNSFDRKQDRYEDYVVSDLIGDAERRFNAGGERNKRAIAGVSMGGFGAVKLALKHPELFAFAGGISSAIDVPSRPFNIRRIQQWRYHRSIFGPSGGESQRANDPFALARSADPAVIPYLFLTCGQQEGLLPANRQFAALLSQRGFRHEFHAVPGGHDWNQWNREVPMLEQSLVEHLAMD